MPPESFDFAYQPSIDGKRLQMLGSGHVIEHGANIIVVLDL